MGLPDRVTGPGGLFGFSAMDGTLPGFLPFLRGTRFPFGILLFLLAAFTDIVV